MDSLATKLHVAEDRAEGYAECVPAPVLLCQLLVPETDTCWAPGLR